MLYVQLLKGDLEQAHRVHGAVDGHLARGGATCGAAAQVEGAVDEARLAHAIVANDANVDILGGLQGATVSTRRREARGDTCLSIHWDSWALLVRRGFSEGVVVVDGAHVGDALDDGMVSQEEGVAADGVVVVVAVAAVAVVSRVARAVPRAGYVTILCAAMRGERGQLLGDVGRGIGSAAERRALQLGRAGGGDALGAGLVLRRDRGRQGKGRRERAALGLRMRLRLGVGLGRMGVRLLELVVRRGGLGVGSAGGQGGQRGEEGGRVEGERISRKWLAWVVVWVGMRG